jgi:hypothetical protein
VPSFEPGDDLVFQLESGFALIRVLVLEQDAAGKNIWHVAVFEEFFPDVDAAATAVARPETLHVRKNLVLTDRAFDRTPAARLGHRPVANEELAPYRDWSADSSREVSDRSILLMLGIR